MASLFGFEFRRVERDEEQKNQPSFAPEVKDDGAVVVAAGGSYGTYVDLMGSARTEAELVTKYREMALHPEVERAVDDIINEAIVVEDNKPVVSINLDETALSENIKKRVREEYQHILDLLNFNQTSFDLFRRWYVDGRMYYHSIIDVNNPGEGIKELRYIDPRKLRKVREVTRKRDKKSQMSTQETVQEYFVYNERGFQNKASDPTSAAGVQGLKIALDSIVHVTSGLVDAQSTLVLSHLHKAIKPLNQLRALEDATIIYRISRAPERRIFYIDVGNLPKMKAEQYLRDMMVRHKNKVVYDSSTGEIRDDRKFMTMLEDYWLPRRDGSRGTEIETLPAGQNLGELSDVEYFQKNLLLSLNVPTSRLQSDGTFNFGQDEAITRDEVKFTKFIKRLRVRFNSVFIESLGKQLMLKNIMTEEEWLTIRDRVKFNYTEDNYYSEQKDVSVMRDRMSTMQLLDPYIGRYYSNAWIRKNILRQTDDDVKENDKQIEAEQKDTLYHPDVAAPMSGNAIPSATAAQGAAPSGVSGVARGDQNN